MPRVSLPRGTARPTPSHPTGRRLGVRRTVEWNFASPIRKDTVRRPVRRSLAGRNVGQRWHQGPSGRQPVGPDRLCRESISTPAPLHTGAPSLRYTPGTSIGRRSHGLTPRTRWRPKKSPALEVRSRKVTPDVRCGSQMDREWRAPYAQSPGPRNSTRSRKRSGMDRYCRPCLVGEPGGSEATLVSDDTSTVPAGIRSARGPGRSAAGGQNPF